MRRSLVLPRIEMLYWSSRGRQSSYRIVGDLNSRHPSLLRLSIYFAGRVRSRPALGRLQLFFNCLPQLFYCGLLLATGLRAQTQEYQPGVEISAQTAPSSYCEGLASKVDQGTPLSRVCQFALSLNARLSGITCSQETMRYSDRDYGGVKLEDVVTAEVSYESGKEHYRNIAINGKKAGSEIPGYAGWSTGEFASVLNGIFAPQSAAEFSFKKEKVLKSGAALIFEFHVKQENNKFWFLQMGSWKVYPGYSGELWIDKSTSRLVRLELGKNELDHTFPLQRVNSTIDYADILLGDGTSLDLPVKSDTIACRSANTKPCFQNTLTFKNWHKFAATTRIVPIADPQTNGKVAQGTVTVPETCPITKPEHVLVPPVPHPAKAPSGQFWFGTEQLWTALPVTGSWNGLPSSPDDPTFRQKLFFWRRGYDAHRDAEPRLTVVGRLLGSPSTTLLSDATSSGSRGGEDEFMVTGATFPSPGCWEITGSYEKSQLTFIIWVTE